MTSIEFLREKLHNDYGLAFSDSIIVQALEIHKAEILAAFTKGSNDGFYGLSDSNREQYYQETFVSKGKIKFTEEEWAELNNAEFPKQEISDDSWEGCDGCTEQDEVMYKNGYVKGYNVAIADLPKEISDEEIEKAALDYDNGVIYGPPLVHFEQGAFWYREQLKQKQ